MKIVIDTERDGLYCPKPSSLSSTASTKSSQMVERTKKWTAEDYVRDQFEKAMKETMLRQEDKVVR